MYRRHLCNCYIEELGQSGRGEGERTLVNKQPGANLPFIGKDKFKSFTDIQTGSTLLGPRNYTSNNSKKVRVVRGGLWLDNSSTNGKRDRADGEWTEENVLPGGKKLKVTPM